MNRFIAMCVAIILPLPVLASERPNILLILADDLGKEGLSFYGDPVHSTPNLDRLAREGMVYTRAFSMPYCSPTRASLLTGLYPFNNGVKRLVSTGDKICLDPLLPNVARTLSDAGYTTGAAGKWHVCGTFLDRQSHPAEMGFDRYALLGRQNHKHDKYERYMSPLVIYNDGMVQKEIFGPDLFANWIENFTATAKKPWFAYWAMNLVHSPTINPIDISPAGKRRYTDMISYMDQLIGEVILRNMVVVFLGDNGTARGMGGGKGTAKDSGTNVPMIVWGLGTGVDHRLVSVTDLHTTLAEIARAAPPETDGQSFLSTERDHVISYTVHKSGVKRMVRDDRWKIRGKPWRLYDLASDIKETRPIRHPHGKALEAKQRLKEYWRVQ